MRYEWPSSSRCAVVLSFDVDAETPLVYRDPDHFEEHVGEYQERLFGVEVGVERILRLLDDYQAPASFFIPAHTVRTHTSTVRAIQAAGHELACHGDMHEPLNEVGEDKEREILQRQLATFDEYLGLRPTGYRAPSFQLNARTPHLLREHGFSYDSSLMRNDMPYTIATASGPLAEIPVHWMLDDAPLYRHVYGATNAIADPDRVLSMWRREFRGLYDENGCFCLTMHPWISGRASRLHVLRELLDEMRTAGAVWFASAADVANWHLHEMSDVRTAP